MLLSLDSATPDSASAPPCETQFRELQRRAGLCHPRWTHVLGASASHLHCARAAVAGQPLPSGGPQLGRASWTWRQTCPHSQDNARRPVRAACRAWPTGRPPTRNTSSTSAAWSSKCKHVAARRRRPGRTGLPISSEGFRGTTPARTTRALPRGEPRFRCSGGHARRAPSVAAGEAGHAVRKGSDRRERVAAPATVCTLRSGTGRAPLGLRCPPGFNDFARTTRPPAPRRSRPRQRPRPADSGWSQGGDLVIRTSDGERQAVPGSSGACSPVLPASASRVDSGMPSHGDAPAGEMSLDSGSRARGSEDDAAELMRLFRGLESGTRGSLLRALRTATVAHPDSAAAAAAAATSSLAEPGSAAPADPARLSQQLLSILQAAGTTDRHTDSPGSSGSRSGGRARGDGPAHSPSRGSSSTGGSPAPGAGQGSSSSPRARGSSRRAGASVLPKGVAVTVRIRSTHAPDPEAGSPPRPVAVGLTEVQVFSTTHQLLSLPTARVWLRRDAGGAGPALQPAEPLSDAGEARAGLAVPAERLISGSFKTCSERDSWWGVAGAWPGAGPSGDATESEPPPPLAEIRVWLPPGESPGSVLLWNFNCSRRPRGAPAAAWPADGPLLAGVRAVDVLVGGRLAWSGDVLCGSGRAASLEPAVVPIASSLTPGRLGRIVRQGEDASARRRRRSSASSQPPAAGADASHGDRGDASRSKSESQSRAGNGSGRAGDDAAPANGAGLPPRRGRGGGVRRGSSDSSGSRDASPSTSSREAGSLPAAPPSPSQSSSFASSSSPRSSARRKLPPPLRSSSPARKAGSSRSSSPSSPSGRDPLLASFKPLPRGTGASSPRASSAQPARVGAGSGPPVGRVSPILSPARTPKADRSSGHGSPTRSGAEAAGFAAAGAGGRSAARRARVVSLASGGSATVGDEAGPRSGEA